MSTISSFSRWVQTCRIMFKGWCVWLWTFQRQSIVGKQVCCENENPAVLENLLGKSYICDTVQTVNYLYLFPSTPRDATPPLAVPLCQAGLFSATFGGLSAEKWQFWLIINMLHIGVFPKWTELSVNSDNLINHWSMNWNQFKDPTSNVCLAGTVVACWSLTQEMASSSPFTVMTNIFVTKFGEFSETF